MDWLAWLAAFLMWLAVVEYTRRWASTKGWIYVVWVGLFVAMGVATHYLIRDKTTAAIVVAPPPSPAKTQNPPIQQTAPSASMGVSPLPNPTTPKPKHNTKPKAPDKPSVSSDGDKSPAVGSITQGAASALSFNQQGGITAGTINLGPPPLQFTWKAEDIPSTKSEFPYEKQVSVDVNAPYTPVSIGVLCDSDIEAINTGFDGAAAFMNIRMGTDDNNKKAGFVAFDSPVLTPGRTLLIWIWSKTPTHVLQLAQAKVNGH